MSAKMLQSGALDTAQSTLSSWQLYVVTFLAEVFVSSNTYAAPRVTNVFLNGSFKYVGV